MYESIPSDDIWDKFEFPPDPDAQYADLLGMDGLSVPSAVVPSHVMGGRHDCMWAGTCSSGMHQRQCSEPEPPAPVVAVTVSVRRSLLRTNRNRTRSASPRPETPSESEEDECSPVFGGVCDNEDLSVAVSASEVTGQISRTGRDANSAGTTPASPPPPPPPRSPVPSYFADHSYHLSKTSVTMDNLGVQTPSDSEEEIDVVSVVDREKLTSLPTNPTARDRHQLQLKVASAIKGSSATTKHRPAKRGRKRGSGTSTREMEQTARKMADRVNKLAHRSDRMGDLADHLSERIQVVTDRINSVLADRPPHRRRRGRDGAGGDKRREHNDMERQRRVDLRESILELKRLLPEVANNDRAPKVQILRAGTKECHFLTGQGRELVATKNSLTERQRELTQRLRELRVSCAKIRTAGGSAVTKSPRKKRMGSR